MDIIDNKMNMELSDLKNNIRKYIREQKQAREQVILAYDKQLFSLYEQQDAIDKIIKRKKIFDPRLLRMQMKLTKKVVRLLNKKFEVEMQPTLDPRLNKIMIKVCMENNGRIDEDHVINFLMGNSLIP